MQSVSKISKLCDHNPPTSQTDRQTDGRTTCDRKTALCTKVHGAVKMTDSFTVLVYLHGVLTCNMIIIATFDFTFIYTITVKALSLIKL